MTLTGWTWTGSTLNVGRYLDVFIHGQTFLDGGGWFDDVLVEVTRLTLIMIIRAFVCLVFGFIKKRFSLKQFIFNFE